MGRCRARGFPTPRLPWKRGPFPSGMPTGSLSPYSRTSGSRSTASAEKSCPRIGVPISRPTDGESWAGEGERTREALSRRSPPGGCRSAHRRGRRGLESPALHGPGDTPPMKHDTAPCKLLVGETSPDPKSGRPRESAGQRVARGCVLGGTTRKDPTGGSSRSRQLKAGMTSRAKSSIERRMRGCSRSPNQKLQLKCVMPTSSWMRLI
jgi:hypothetical protein